LSLVDGLLIALFLMLYVAAIAWDAMARPKRLTSLFTYSAIGSAALLTVTARTEGLSLEGAVRGVVLATAITAGYHLMVWARGAMMGAALYDTAKRRDLVGRLRSPKDLSD
jgi:hypothetical protein